jgi:hypothetical protein
MNPRLSLTLLALALTAGPAWCQEAVSEQEKQAELEQAEKVLRSAQIKTDGASLLQYFRERIPSAEEQQRLPDLVVQLGDLSYRNRSRATATLIRVGRQALPFLQEGLKAEDPEIANRAEICLQSIFDNEVSEAPRLSAAVRLLAERKPEGAAAVLLDLAPFVSDPETLTRIGTALEQVGFKDGKPRPEVLAAVGDRFAARRALAGEALAKAAPKRGDVLGLLKDPDPDVRLQVALALAHAGTPDAGPALIDLIEKLPEDRAWRAQDTLYRLAADEPPAAELQKAATPKEVRQAWEKWWQRNREQVPALLAKLARNPQSMGYTLITQMNLQGGTNGAVFELGPDKKPRWKIEGLRYPVDAEVVGHNRVVMAEYIQNQVTERDFQGQVLWSKQVSLPTGVQRLPDGNTFVAARRMLLILDRTGKEVFTCQPTATISAARRARNGNIVVVTNTGVCMTLDPKGQQIGSFKAGPVYTMGGGIDLLPSGRILIPEYRTNRVAEYAPDGKLTWQASVRFPTSASRLPNGNTLVVSMVEQRVVELNRSGDVVWEFRTDGRPWRARRR